LTWGYTGCTLTSLYDSDQCKINAMKQKIKILHLEDMPLDAELVAATLNRENIDSEILVVPNRAAFVKALKGFSFDIVLSDHSLASFDSREALAMIKNAGITTPFILVTATMDDEFAAKVMKEGACDYVLKDRLHRLPQAVIGSIKKHRSEELHQAMQKVTMLQLIKSEAFSKGVLNSLSSHIAVIDELGNIVAVNEAWKCFGLENGETVLQRSEVGSNYFSACEKAAGSGDRIAQRTLSGIKQVMAEKKAIYYLEYPCHSIAKQQWFGMRVTKFENDEPRVVVAHLDITDRKISELRLQESNENLQKNVKELAISNAELEQFAYVASHDLQEPLRMVTSFMTQLENKYDDILDDKGKQYIRFAVDGAKRMRQIILDLLEFSTVGKTGDEPEEVNLNHLINEILALYRKQIEEKQACIEVHQLPVLHIHTPPIRQVFQNLIGNSLKYQKHDVGPVISIACEETISHWQFSVKDNGIGIGREYFDKIFIIFQRLHNKDEYSGTGMGLAVTKKIVENLGGTIWVESQEGTGSTFYFTISKRIAPGIR